MLALALVAALALPATSAAVVEWGTAGADSLVGTAASDTLRGLDGADNLIGRAAAGGASHVKRIEQGRQIDVFSDPLDPQKVELA